MAQTIALSAINAGLPAVGQVLQNDKAWKEAIALYDASSNATTPKELMTSTHPGDIRKYLEEVQQRQKKSKLTQTSRCIKSCLDTLARHEKALDIFAQAGGMPGCVAWGSIRLALEVRMPIYIQFIAPKSHSIT